MYQVGIDVGSSAAKAVVMEGKTILKKVLLSTGFSSRQTADHIYDLLAEAGFTEENARYVATGYGRVSVP